MKRKLPSDYRFSNFSRPLIACIFLSFLFSQITVSQDYNFYQNDDNDGLVVMEAENYSVMVDNSGNDSIWHVVTTPEGYSGTGALRAPNNAATTTASGSMAKSPYLQYNINFVKKGDHYIWIRASHESGSDDSYHVVLAAEGDLILDSLLFINFELVPKVTNPTWVWTHSSNKESAKINVPSAGDRQFRICMREKLIQVDKIVLTTNASYIPADDTLGVGPDETVVGIADLSVSNGKLQAYPVPFSSNTTITYNLNAADITTLKIYNNLGQEVAVLTNEFQAQGTHQIDWNGTGMDNKKLANGIYYLKLICGNQIETIRTVIAR